jgi:excisionase family DNA binding protein
MSNESKRELLTATEATEVLPLKPATIRAWILYRRIPYVKLGRRVFLRRKDLEKVLVDNLVPAREATAGSLCKIGAVPGARPGHER